MAEGPAHCAATDDTLECAALVDLAVATQWENWVFSKNWLSGASICDWDLVGCDASGHVKILSLSFNNMTGFLPPSLGALKHLLDLDIEGNHISGAFPSSVATGLANLQELGIGSNKFQGVAPVELCGLRATQGPACDASGNDWACPLPACLVQHCGATCTPAN